MIAGCHRTAHWHERVQQRLGRNVCPDALAIRLFAAIDAGRTDEVEYVGRVRRDGTRAFRFRADDGRPCVALLDMDTRSAITVLVRDQMFQTEDGRQLPVDPAALPPPPPPRKPRWRR